MTQVARSPMAALPAAQEPLLEVKNLVTYFGIKGGLMQRVVANVKAVDHAGKPTGAPAVSLDDIEHFRL